MGTLRNSVVFLLLGVASMSCKSTSNNASDAKTIQTEPTMWGVSTLMWSYRFLSPNIQEKTADRDGYEYNSVCIYTTDVANFNRTDDALQAAFKKARPVETKPTNAIKLTAAALKRDQRLGTQIVDILHGQLMEVTRGGIDYHSESFERAGRQDAGNGQVSGEVKGVTEVHSRIFNSYIELARENLVGASTTCPAQHPRSI